MGTLSTAAWIGHDLAVAADFGGSLFGKFALDPAVQEIESFRERGAVVHKAWSGYKWVNLGSVAVLGGTWLLGRLFLDGWEVGKHSRRLVLAKDILVGGAVLTGIAAAINGSRIDEHAPLITSGQPGPGADVQSSLAQKIERPLGIAHLAFIGGVAAVTAALAMKSGRSFSWSFISRFLP